MITRGFNHVATLTPDLDRYAEFYTTVFAAEVTLRVDAEGDHPRMFIIDLGGASLNTFEVAVDDIIGDRRRIGHRGAIDHFGLHVESLGALEQVKQRLLDVGADIGEIQRLGNEWSLFFRDVDGNELEVCAPTS